MKKDMNYMAFLWHAILLSVTATFIEINTVLPAMIIQIGGNEFHIGIMTTIMIGIPLVAKLLFAGFLHARPVKRFVTSCTRILGRAILKNRGITGAMRVRINRKITA